VQKVVQLTVRREGASHAAWDDAHWVDESNTDLGQTNILLLVHGFANSMKKAHASYEKFISRVREENESFPGTWGAMCEFHWPGDYPGHRILSFLTYSTRVPVAKGSGQSLARFLHENEQLTSRQQLYIVGHSLGCRVVLEALKEISRIKDYNGPVVREVALLAAAVPVQECMLSSGEFKPISSGHEHVFYSRRDLVLLGPFGPGQFFFGERGHAVGREGGPKDRWQQPEQTKLGHGDYWADRDYIAPGVAGILGFGPRRLPECYLPEVEADVAEPPSSREVEEREPSSGWRE
jgi:Alpha/beta hydrolase of unknown function (DUF900)